MALDPVTLAVLASALAGVAEEAGSALVRSAYSSNIKERRDCSSALFDARGRLVAQAAHIPVHLGSMHESVEAVMARRPEPGDVFALNDPFAGGTHLPDITLVTPIVPDGEVFGFAVTRAHHSDVGGKTPGSMPSDSTEIFQEGLIIPPVRLVARGQARTDLLDLLCANSRTPLLRRGDFQAQIAANQLAATRVGDLVARWGRSTIAAAFDELIVYAERRTRALIAELPDGTYRAVSEIEGDGITDDDIPIEVAVTVDGEEMRVDFTGTAPASRGNVNCPLSVTRSACCFALRVLLPDDVPSNAGAYSPMTLVVPERSLLHAARPAAVVAGNVETSQRVADTVLAALAQIADLPAAGQGTMNNVVIGGDGWTYYETIGGGQGATRWADGPSGVHVGMTNTLNTPIEALEIEYPMRVERYELAEGSGGAGRHRGGDGIVRSIRLLADARISLLTDRRRHSPAGADGGGGGAPGRNELDGELLPPKVTVAARAGSVLTIVTPGGGGMGAPSAGVGPEDAGRPDDTE